MSDSPPAPPEPLRSSTGLPQLDPPIDKAERQDSQELASRFLMACVGLAALFYLFDQMRALLVPMALAVLLNLVLGPVVRRLSAAGLPRVLSAGGVLLVLLGGLSGLILLAAPSVEAWLSELPSVIRSLHADLLDNDKVNALLDAKLQAEVTSSELNMGSAVPVRLKDSNTGDWLIAGTGMLANLVIIIFLAFMMLAAGDRFRHRLRRALSGSSLGKRMTDAARAVESSVSTYMLTISAINAGLGVTVGIAMWLMGLEQPLVWGMLAGLLNFVPYIGPMISMVLIGLGGYASWGGLDGLVLPALVYLVINAIEAFGVTPVLLGNRLQLSPVATLVSVIFWTWLWGLGGALIAIPMLVVLYVVFIHLAALRPLAVLVSR